MILIICEKNSVAKAIAECFAKKMGERFERVTPYPKDSKTGFYTIKDYVIMPCRGHLLRTYEPQEYDEKYAKWRVSDLPLCPPEFKSKPEKDCEKHFKMLQEQYDLCSEVINAGDLDFEGELVVQEVLWYLNNTKPTKRMCVSNNTVDGIWRAFQNMDDNKNHEVNAYKALYRQMTDWRFGMNLSRLFSLLYRNELNELKAKTFTIGRVQTAILTMIVERDLAHENHEVSYFYRVLADIKVMYDGGSVILPNVRMVNDPQRHTVDDKNRLVDKDQAQQIANNLLGAVGSVRKLNKDTKKVPQPLCFNKSKLQQYVLKNNKENITTSNFDSIVQSLYEKKLISYPRTEVQYLPPSYLAEAKEIVDSLAGVTFFAPICKNVDLTIVSRSWNAEKTDNSAHHGILPVSPITEEIFMGLTSQERYVYAQIVRLYLAQFLPPAVDLVTVLEISLGDEMFKVHQTLEQSKGWRMSFTEIEDSTDSDDEGEKSSTDTLNDVMGGGLATLDLSPIKLGDHAQGESVQATSHKTSPPKRYTGFEITQHLSNISRHLKNPQLKEFYKEIENHYKEHGQTFGGIGTSATLNSIFEKLFTNEYIEEDGKYLKSTKVGRFIYATLDDYLKRPDVTAYWFAYQSKIKTRQDAIDFSDRITKETVYKAIDEYVKRTGYDVTAEKNAGNSNVPDAIKNVVEKCPFCGSNLKYIVPKDSSKPPLWMCSNQKCHYHCPADANTHRACHYPASDKACSKCGKATFVKTGIGKNGNPYTALACSSCKNMDFQNNKSAMNG